MAVGDDVSGTFDALNEESGTVFARRVMVSLQVGSNSTVQVRRRFDGTNWRVVVSKTADEEFELESAAPCEWQLKQSVHSGNSTYHMRPEQLDMIPGR